MVARRVGEAFDVVLTMTPSNPQAKPPSRQRPFAYPVPQSGITQPLRAALGTALYPVQWVAMQPVDYNVTLYVMETGDANSRLFDVTLNDASLQGIGQLPKNGWAAYGPLTTTVTKGVLALMAKAKKGSPQFMGMSIFTVANETWTNAFLAGQAHDVPGTWLFADFDRGANGVAFQEREDVQIRPMYRSEAVSVHAIQGIPVVAEVSGGEWLRYTINAKTAGTYAMAVKYSKVLGANALKSRVEGEVDGKTIGKAIELEDTGGWDMTKSSTLSGISLTVGIHDLRLLFYGAPNALGNFWSIEFVRTGP